MLDSLVRRTPYTAVKWTSKATAGGRGDILFATMMEELYHEKNDNTDRGRAFQTSVGLSLNYGVNQLADVLHTFFLNVVAGN